MRRLLRSIAKGEEITQDVSTLENPAILEQLKQTDVSATSKPSLKGQRLVALFLLGCLLFNFPLLSLFNVRGDALRRAACSTPTSSSPGRC